MSFVTFTTNLDSKVLGHINTLNQDGIGFSFTKPGTYTVTGSVPWAYDADDSVAFADMDNQVASGHAEEFVVTDTTLTYYCKTEGLSFDTLKVTYEETSAEEAVAGSGLDGATGSSNTRLGVGTLATLNTGTKNVAGGVGAGAEIVDGVGNIHLGYHAGKGNGDVSNFLSIGSSDAKINYIDIPSANAYGAGFTSPMSFRDRLTLAGTLGAPTDANIPAGYMTLRVNEGGDAIEFRVRYQDGTTYKTGTIALT